MVDIRLQTRFFKSHMHADFDFLDIWIVKSKVLFYIGVSNENYLLSFWLSLLPELRGYKLESFATKDSELHVNRFPLEPELIRCCFIIFISDYVVQYVACCIKCLCLQALRKIPSIKH